MSSLTQARGAHPKPDELTPLHHYIRLDCPADPRSVSLSGRVDGFQAPALGALEVQAVNANDGTVAGVATASRGGYRLTVAPGPYLVHVQDEDLRNGTTEGFSDVTSLGSAGGRLSVAPGGPPAAVAAAGVPARRGRPRV
ncbi:MAG: carboxypeptidase-like regulatory domain-containing protein [Solirubrobacteraceae bacterium]